MIFLINIFRYNSFIIFNWYGVIVDLFYYIKSIMVFKKLSKNKYERFILNIDWLGMGYLILNYDENFFNDLTQEQQEMWIYNDTSKLNEDIAKNDILDTIKNKYSMLTLDGQDTFSVLVDYKPVFYYINFGILIRTIIAYAMIYYFVL